MPCPPSAAGCTPRRGTLAFNSESPPTYAYWTMFGLRHPGPRGRLRGRLTVQADAGAPSPAVPGFPGQCEGAVCFGQQTTVTGRMVGDRLQATARYVDGAICYFDLAMAFGLGEPEANRFECRNAAGVALSRGPLRVQMIRLTGCRNSRR